MSAISALHDARLAVALARTAVREGQGHKPPPNTIHGRNYQPLRAAYAALNAGDRPRALEALGQVPDWDWVGAKCHTAVHGRTNVAPGQLRTFLTDFAAHGDLEHADMLHLPALAVLADYFKNH